MKKRPQWRLKFLPPTSLSPALSDSLSSIKTPSPHHDKAFQYCQIRPSRLFFTNRTAPLFPSSFLCSTGTLNDPLLHPTLATDMAPALPAPRPLCNIRSPQRNTSLHALSTRLISGLFPDPTHHCFLSPLIPLQSAVHYWFACKLQ